MSGESERMLLLLEFKLFKGGQSVLSIRRDLVGRILFLEAAPAWQFNELFSDCFVARFATGQKSEHGG